MQGQDLSRSNRECAADKFHFRDRDIIRLNREELWWFRHHHHHHRGEDGEAQYRKGREARKGILAVMPSDYVVEQL